MERIQEALEKAKLHRQSKAREDQIITKADDKDHQQLDSDDAVYNYIHSHINPRTFNVDQNVLREHRIVADLKDDPRADIFKILRSKILQRMRSNHMNVIAVTSPTAGNGKSLIATSLAISVAMEANHSVLLVDLDFRRPNIHNYFGLSPKQGVIDYLNDGIPLSDLFIYPDIEGLVILPAGQSIRHSSELLSTQKMKDLADEIKNRYSDRVVIIDLPPLLHTDDVIVFLPKVDACILVVAEGENTKAEVERSLALIDEKKYLGSVLNKSSEIWHSSYY